jgi:hypothetical protein
MRKSTSTRRARLAYAGLATGTVAAAVFVAPQAAFAAATAVPSVGPAGTSVTITEDSPTTAFTNANTVAVQLQAGTTCSTTALALSSNVFAAASATKTASTVTFTVPSTAALGTNGVARQYAICLYTAGTAGSAAVGLSSVPTYVLSAAATTSPTSGASGGGNTVTVTSPTAAAVFTTTATPAAVFTTNPCPTTYGTPTTGTASGTRTSNNVATVAVPASVVGTGVAATPYNVCLYAGTTSSSALLAASTYSAALPTLTPSTTALAATSANNLTAQSTANFLTASTAPAVVFATGTTCPANVAAAPGTAVTASDVRKLANNRLSVTVSGLSTANSPYTMCVYANNTTGALLAAAAVTVATVQTVTGVSPAAGPTLGGSTITITGTNFPATGITGTLGGAPLTDIVRVNDTTLTAITPARTAGAANLVISSAAGTSAPFAGFTYRNAIRISPNTAPNDAGYGTVWVDVLGVGFQNITFSGVAANRGRVWLVDATGTGYNPTDNAGDYTVGPIAECDDVQVIADNELICGLDLEAGQLDPDDATPLGSTAVPDGTYSLTVVNNGALDAQTAPTYSQTVVSSGSTFTVADF